ncbi:unnamed protein product [Owenia fusiformis]|uniref:Hydroxylysine kinase n=1 Tax=Owenia fusiformis TaxID=6347 RepID=A0A8S4NNI1_OWEFU|nr:unnamed protein product [Owenia fusiformis]
MTEINKDGVENRTVLMPSEATKARNVPKEKIYELVFRLFGMTVLSSRKVDSWDDQNFYITCKDTDNTIQISPHGYTLKIVNAVDSKVPAFIDAQHAMAKRISESGLTCPVPVKNLKSSYKSLEELSTENGNVELRLVHMVTFIPGEVLADIPLTPSIVRHLGGYMTKLRGALQGFYHAGYEDHQTIYNIECTPKLMEFMESVTGCEKKELYTEVIRAYESEIVPKYDSLTKGVIHGDITAKNIIMNKNSPDCNVAAVIDFGDSVNSVHVFDLAVAIAAFIYESKLDVLEILENVLSPYTKVFPLTAEESSVLKVAIAARLTIIGVMVEYMYSLKKEAYFLEEGKNAYKRLKEFWEIPVDEINKTYMQ